MKTNTAAAILPSDDFGDRDYFEVDVEIYFTSKFRQKILMQILEFG